MLPAELLLNLTVMSRRLTTGGKHLLRTTGVNADLVPTTTTTTTADVYARVGERMPYAQHIILGVVADHATADRGRTPRERANWPTPVGHSPVCVQAAIIPFTGSSFAVRWGGGAARPLALFAFRGAPGERVHLLLGGVPGAELPRLAAALYPVGRLKQAAGMGAPLRVETGHPFQCVPRAELRLVAPPLPAAGGEGASRNPAFCPTTVPAGYTQQEKNPATD